MNTALERLRRSDSLLRRALLALRQYAAARKQRRGVRVLRAEDISPHLRRDIGLGREWVE